MPDTIFCDKILFCDNSYLPIALFVWPLPEGMTEADLILSEKDTKWGGIEEYKKERNL